MATNEYSALWFGTFADAIAPEQTRREVQFLARHLPLPAFRRVLDVGCGTGRHAAALLECGYELTCIDVNDHALGAARERLGGRARIVRHDMRQLERFGESFDAVLMLWQGFGYFDAATNRACLRQVAAVLRAGGRFVLDVYHRGFFEAHLGERRHERAGRAVVERKSMHGDRLRVELDYGEGRGDAFDWQLFTPEEIVADAAKVGLSCLTQCSDFDERRRPSELGPRMQFVLERL